MIRLSRETLVTLAFVWASAFAAASNPSPSSEKPTTVVVKVFDAHGVPVADAVVFDYSTPGQAFAPPDRPYEMDQIHKEFVPHVLPILVGSRVRFPNKDDIHHDLYSFSPAKTFEFPLYKGEPAKPVRFDKPGVVQLGCNIHDWMSGIILVLSNPYFGKTEANGKATLSGMPSDKDVQLAVFHERLNGKVADTLKTIHWDSFDGKPLLWKINLKPERKKKRPAIDY